MLIFYQESVSSKQPLVNFAGFETVTLLLKSRVRVWTSLLFTHPTLYIKCTHIIIQAYTRMGIPSPIFRILKIKKFDQCISKAGRKLNSITTRLQSLYKGVKRLQYFEKKISKLTLKAYHMHMTSIKTNLLIL